MKKTNFNPNKIKFLLEYKGFGRVTDTKLAELFGVKKNTIARWKIRSPILFDKIANTGFLFDRIIEMPNDVLINSLKMNPLTAYNWNKKRPYLLEKTKEFLDKHNIKFEEIYENNN